MLQICWQTLNFVFPPIQQGHWETENEKFVYNNQQCFAFQITSITAQKFKLAVLGSDSRKNFDSFLNMHEGKKNKSMK